MPRTAETLFLGDASSLERAAAQASASIAALQGKLAAASKGMEASNAGVAASAEASAARTQKAHEKTIASFGKLGRDAAVGIGAVIVGAADMGLKMEHAAGRIAASSGISVEAAKKIEDQFEKTAGTAIVNAAKIGEAYAKIAGELRVVEGHALTGAQALKVMDAAMNLMEASGSSLDEATESLGKAMMTFHLHASEAAEASDILFSASKATGTSIGEFTTMVDKARGRLGALAPSFKETAGFMAELAKQGVAGRLTMGALGGVFGTLLSNSKPVNAVLSEMKVHVFNSHHEFVGLKSVIEQMSPAFAKLTQERQLEYSKVLFGEKANKQLLEVIRQGPAAFEAATRTVAAHGAAQEAAKKHSETFAGQLEKAKAAAEDFAGVIGKALIPYLKALVEAIKGAVSWLKEHESAAKALAGVIVTVLGAAITLFVEQKIAKFLTGIKSMTSALAQLVTRSTTTAAGVGAADAAMVAETDAAAAAMKAALITTGIGAALVVLAAAAFQLQGQWKQVMQGLEEAAESVANFVVDRINEIIHAINQLTGKLTLGLAPAIGEVSRLSGAGEGGGKQPLNENEPLNQLRNKRHISRSPAEGSNQARIVEAAMKYHIDPETLFGVYGTETNFGKNVNTSSAGAKGAFQFIEGTAKEYKYPYTNKQTPAIFGQQADAAAHYLSDLIKQHHGDVNAALQAYSGNTPGYAQKASEHAKEFGKVSSPSIEELKAHERQQKAKAEAYVDPFAGASNVHRSRTDQGVDFSFAGALGAIGKGIIEKVVNFQGFGQTIVERLTSGPHKGQRIYTGLETGGVSTVHSGQAVRAGQQIARGYGTGGIETGFAGPDGLPITRGSGETAGGKAFSKFLASIGHTGSPTQLATSEYSAVVKQQGEEAKKALAQQAADGKAGQSQLQKMVAAIQQGGVKELTSVVGGKHDTWLGNLVGKLHGDHTAGLDKLARLLTDAHSKAMALVPAAMERERAEQQSKFTEAMDTIKSKMVEMAHGAAEAFKSLKTAALEAAYSAELKGIEGGPKSGEIKAAHEKDEAESDARSERENKLALEQAKKNLKEVKAQGDKEKTKEAELQVTRAEEAITEFARHQDEKRKEKSVQEEKDAAGARHEVALAAIEQQTRDYENMLNTQLGLLDGQLAQGVISYEKFAAEVNAILAGSGIAPYKTEAGFPTAPPPPGTEYAGPHGELTVPEGTKTIRPYEEPSAHATVHFSGPVNLNSPGEASRLADKINFRAVHG